MCGQPEAFLERDALIKTTASNRDSQTYLKNNQRAFEKREK